MSRGVHTDAKNIYTSPCNSFVESEVEIDVCPLISQVDFIFSLRVYRAVRLST